MTNILNFDFVSWQDISISWYVSIADSVQCSTKYNIKKYDMLVNFEYQVCHVHANIV